MKAADFPTRSKWKRIAKATVLSLAVVGFLAVCYGNQLFGIPDWDRLFSWTGMGPKTVAEGEAEITFFDFGNMDCTLIRTAEHAVLIDTGEGDAFGDLSRELQRRGVTGVDLLLLSHCHQDHAGGARRLLEEFSVKQVWLPPEQEETAALSGVVKATAEQQKTPVKTVKAGDSLMLGELSLKVLSAHRPDEKTEANDTSVVCLLRYGRRSFLFTGDAGKAVEERMLEAQMISRTDLLKVGHHGSDSSSGEEFLRRASPRVAVITGGADGGGLPSQKVLDRLTKVGATVYRTNVHGTVTAVTDGIDLQIRTEEF